MKPTLARVLLLADTHLGIDLPFRPRIHRRRRGHDFFANLDRALQPALQGAVDLVVHGGDLFFRSKIPAGLVDMAMSSLVRVANKGVPVYLVPGNHERSRIPLHLWTAHPNIHIFDRPRTYLCRLSKGSVALSGFPFSRKACDRFRELVVQTRYPATAADVRLLCLHQTVEGAQVGTGNYTFRAGPDIVPGHEIPPGFAAVLAGHIHRAQVLTHDLACKPLAAPVIYPGSIERTSFAERDEDKGYMIADLGLSGLERGRLVDLSFVKLPARPMVSITIETGKVGELPLADSVRGELATLDPNSVVRIQLQGPGAADAAKVLSASRLRELAPARMNVTVRPHP